jgi:hypothetical protein
MQPEKPEMQRSYDAGYFSNKDRSPEFFQNTRVNTCTHISMKNGRPVAIPFKPMTPAHMSSKTRQKSEFREGDTMYRSTYAKMPQANAGTMRKPLMKYDPQADRNRLPNLSLKMNSPYYDQINIGDRDRRGQIKSNPWVTEYKTRIGNFVDTGCFSHPGILTRMTKYHRDRMNNY